MKLRRRKVLAAHHRGEHDGYNLKFARSCPPCAEDVERVVERWDQTIRAVWDDALSRGQVSREEHAAGTACLGPDGQVAR